MLCNRARRLDYKIMR
ncbi:TPA: hypothetical protein ACYZ04_003671 [Escherichia coli]|nr:hypothetical protein [Escherichia coli]